MATREGREVELEKNQNKKEKKKKRKREKEGLRVVRFCSIERGRYDERGENKKEKEKKRERESEEQLRLGLEGTADGGWISDVAIS